MRSVSVATSAPVLSFCACRRLERIAELPPMKTNGFQYYVTARRPTGETLFFCNSATQGPRMIPTAHSMARRFDSRKLAREQITKTAPGFKGLTGWQVNREIVQ